MPHENTQCYLKSTLHARGRKELTADKHFETNMTIKTGS
jgi:hypothetical protein